LRSPDLTERDAGFGASPARRKPGGASA
jgi:hypothetical protein